MDTHSGVEMKARAADAERLEWQKFLAELRAILWRLLAKKRLPESRVPLASPVHRVAFGAVPRNGFPWAIAIPQSVPRSQSLPLLVGRGAPVLQYGVPAPQRSARG